MEIDEFVFKHPFTCMMVGPSKSGKTTLLKRILKSYKLIIDPEINRIVYCYSVWQDEFNIIKSIVPIIEFREGLPDIDDFDKSLNNLLILDDLMEECSKERSLYRVFTIYSHHKNISVFFLVQNLFPKEKNFRTMSINVNYIILFNNPRDRSQFNHLARQVFPENTNFLTECFRDAVDNKPFGYLFMDFTQSTRRGLRIQTGICPDDQRVIYQEKE